MKRGRQKKALVTGILLALTLGCGLWAARATQAAAASDQGVAKALDAEKMKYEVSDKGNFRIILSFDDKRTQLVIVNSSTSTFRGGDWRDVYSKAFEVTGNLSEQQANDLLDDSDHNVFGAWCTNHSDGKTYVYYQVAVSIDANATELHNAISLVGIAADEMEKKVTGKDDN